MNGEVVQPSEEVQFILEEDGNGYTAILAFEEVKKEDEGKIELVAINDFGSDKVQLQLDVKSNYFQIPFLM